MATDMPVEVTTVNDFVDEILPFTESDTLLLRGHCCASWTLIPKLGRVTLRRGMTRTQTEQKLFEQFQLRSVPYLQRPPKDAWDVLAMAQHHGLATRLLDWTESPLAALWFAVREPAVADEAGAVWAFVPEDDDFVDKAASTPFSVSRTLFFRPSHLNARIVAQNGWFSVHKYNVNKQSFSTLERVKSYKQRVKKILVPARAFASVRYDLDRLGINDAALFPDLDGLSNHLTWAHTWLEDERGGIETVRAHAASGTPSRKKAVSSKTTAKQAVAKKRVGHPK